MTEKLSALFVLADAAQKVHCGGIDCEECPLYLKQSLDAKYHCASADIAKRLREIRKLNNEKETTSTMRIKRTQTFTDYREAMDAVKTHLVIGATIEQNVETCDYTVTWFEQADSKPELMRIFLNGISKDYELIDEEKDAIAYADSAIKTLVDMGVLS